MSMFPSEYIVSLPIIMGFILSFIILAWPEYEEVERIYNPDAEPYARRPAKGKAAWQQLRAALLKGGWKTEKIKRRKR